MKLKILTIILLVITNITFAQDKSKGGKYYSEKSTDELAKYLVNPNTPLIVLDRNG